MHISTDETDAGTDGRCPIIGSLPRKVSPGPTIYRQKSALPGTDFYW